MLTCDVIIAGAAGTVVLRHEDAVLQHTWPARQVQIQFFGMGEGVLGFISTMMGFVGGFIGKWEVGKKAPKNREVGKNAKQIGRWKKSLKKLGRWGFLTAYDLYEGKIEKMPKMRSL